MSEVQPTEYLYTYFEDPNGQIPSHWNSHRILRRTNLYIFVRHTIGIFEETRRINREELEARGYAYWSKGTYVCRYYTDAKKNVIAEFEKLEDVPECLRALGLVVGASLDDVKGAFRKAALRAHPDGGGTHEAFLELKKHYQAALYLVRQ